LKIITFARVLESASSSSAHPPGKGEKAVSNVIPRLRGDKKNKQTPF
jgi:hypothetical protein